MDSFYPVFPHRRTTWLKIGAAVAFDFSLTTYIVATSKSSTATMAFVFAPLWIVCFGCHSSRCLRGTCSAAALVSNDDANSLPAAGIKPLFRNELDHTSSAGFAHLVDNLLKAFRLAQQPENRWLSIATARPIQVQEEMLRKGGDKSGKKIEAGIRPAGKHFYE